MTENEFARLPGDYQRIEESDPVGIRCPRGARGARGSTYYRMRNDVLPKIFGREKLAELLTDNAIISLIRYKETGQADYWEDARDLLNERARLEEWEDIMK